MYDDITTEGSAADAPGRKEDAQVVVVQ